MDLRLWPTQYPFASGKQYIPSHRLKTETIAIYNFYWYHINRAVRNVAALNLGMK